MNIELNNASSQKIIKYNIFDVSRNKNKLISIKKNNGCLNTLDYYRNSNKFQEYKKRIFFTNEKIKSHFKNVKIQADSLFNKNILMQQLEKNPILKYKKFISPKLTINVETNINTVKHFHFNPNLSINKVNFNISRQFITNYNNNDQLKKIKKKLKKIRYQTYNEYNMKKRQEKDNKIKSYSDEKDIESTLNTKNVIKANDYFRVFKLKKINSRNQNIKYHSVKTQIKMDNNYIDKKINNSKDINNFFDNISNKIEGLKHKIKINNIIKRTESTLGSLSN